MARTATSGPERGGVLIVAAATMTALLIGVAMVVDLGLTRHVRRSNQSLADLSALAAGDSLGADPKPDAQTACSDAMKYLRANETTIPIGLNVPCGDLPAACDLSTAPVTVTDGGTGADWTVRVMYPVPDTVIADDDVAATGGLRVSDGDACERLQVEVSRTIDSVFGGIVGRENYTISASAVVRQVKAGDRRVPALWLLDPYGCPTLDVQGGSQVTVGTPTFSGLITIDSDASGCTGNSFTIDTGGTGAKIIAIPDDLEPPAEISLVAMNAAQIDCATGNPNACDPADVASGQLYPQPQRRPSRVTRGPIDHAYNCKTGYPDYHGVAIMDCSGAPTAFIDQLRSEVGSTGTPAGFQRWSDSYGCNDPTVPPTGLDGNWHVDCSTLKITSADVVFNGGNVVVDGSISLTGGSISFNTGNPSASLPFGCEGAISGCVDESSAGAAWVYMRAGNLTLTGGALNAAHTLVYQHDGYFSISGGSPPVWSSPVEGPLTGLSVWSEKSSGKFKINGGASMELEGTFFTPEAAPLSISGGAPVVPQQAQFATYRMSISGGASLTLSPNLATAVVLPVEAPLLIR